MKGISLKNWGTARIIRLVAGIGLIVFGLMGKENTPFAFLGGLFVFQAVANLACCCGGGSCDTGISRTERNVTESQENDK